MTISSLINTSSKRLDHSENQREPSAKRLRTNASAHNYSIESLPNDILKQIFSFCSYQFNDLFQYNQLTYDNISSLRLTCKRWAAIVGTSNSLFLKSLSKNILLFSTISSINEKKLQSLTAEEKNGITSLQTCLDFRSQIPMFGTSNFTDQFPNLAELTIRGEVFLKSLEELINANPNWNIQCDHLVIHEQVKFDQLIKRLQEQYKEKLSSLCNSIRILKIDSCNCGDAQVLLNFIKSCPKLEGFRLDLTDYFAKKTLEEITAEILTSCPKLSSLRINYGDDASFSFDDFLEKIEGRVFPNIKILYLPDGTDKQPRNFHLKHFPSLEHFYFRGFLNATPAQRIDFLNALPPNTLKSLYLAYICLDRKLLEILAKTQPQLETLSFCLPYSLCILDEENTVGCATIANTLTEWLQPFKQLRWLRVRNMFLEASEDWASAKSGFFPQELRRLNQFSINDPHRFNQLFD